MTRDEIEERVKDIFDACNLNALNKITFITDFILEREKDLVEALRRIRSVPERCDLDSYVVGQVDVMCDIVDNTFKRLGYSKGEK